jgi:hypothetical protein
MKSEHPNLKTIVGMFFDTADAHRAVYNLDEVKLPLADVSVAMRERYDSAFGRPSGGLLSLAVSNQANITPTDYGLTSVKGLHPATAEDSPGFGPIIAAGPLAAGMGGAALGKAAGGLTGTLSDIGITNEAAIDIVERVRSGKETLVCIQVHREDAERVEKLFLDNGANTVYRGTDHTGDYTKGARASRAAELGF